MNSMLGMGMQRLGKDKRMELDKLIEHVDFMLGAGQWELEPNTIAFYTNMSNFLHRHKEYVAEEYS